MFFSFFRPTNEKEQAKDGSSSKKNAGAAKTRESSLNRNGRVELEARQTRQTSRRNKEQGSGSSVDPGDEVEPMDSEESAESSHADKKSQEDSHERSNVPPPKR